MLISVVPPSVVPRFTVPLAVVKVSCVVTSEADPAYKDIITMVVISRYSWNDGAKKFWFCFCFCFVLFYNDQYRALHYNVDLTINTNTLQTIDSPLWSFSWELFRYFLR